MSRSLANARNAAFLLQSSRCFYCGLPMWQADCEGFARRLGLTPRQAGLLRCTAEHLRARQHGGSNCAGNIVAACHYCNQRRHRRGKDLSPAQFLQLVQRRIARERWHCAPIAQLLRRSGP